MTERLLHSAARLTLRARQPEAKAHPLVRAAVLQFAEYVLHGSDAHQQWLRDAALAYVDGKPLPPGRS